MQRKKYFPGGRAGDIAAGGRDMSVEELEFSLLILKRIKIMRIFQLCIILLKNDEVGLQKIEAKDGYLVAST